MADVTITVNGTDQTVDVEPEMPLLWVLRDVLTLTGTKFSCGIGACGACSVLMDGELTRSCITTADQAEGTKVTTIEGLRERGDHPVQIAWLDLQVAQCGYCQPGQIMTAVALLARNPTPTSEDVDAAFADVLCRCGTYQRIHAAVLQAAQAAG